MSAANNGGAILAIDAGTTGVTALVVTPDGRIDAKGYQEFRQHFPRPGWVEHAPEEIWQATLEATRDCLTAWDGKPGDLSGIGITNQRETVLLWDRETLGLTTPGDRLAGPAYGRHLQSAARGGPRGAGHRADRAAPGPLLLRHQAGVAGRERAEHLGAGRQGRYAVGTVDSYLIARMTRGTWHITDVSNACRTLLFDLEAGEWSKELCELFGVPMDALPEVVPNWGELARTDPKSFLDLDLPIAGIAGRPAVGAVRSDLLRRG